MKTKKIKKRWIIIGASICFIVPTCIVRCTKVDTAEAGIKFNKLSLTDQGTLDATSCAGFVFYNPITTDVYTYPTFVQRVDYEAFSVTTRDAATFSMDPLLAYQIDRNKAINIFARYRRSLEDIQVVRGVDKALDNEAVRVIKTMPKWNPGKQRGKPVRVRFTLPVNFKLQ